MIKREKGKRMGREEKNGGKSRRWGMSLNGQYLTLTNYPTVS